MFLIRDAQGVVYNTVEVPAVVYDFACSVIIKIGESTDMKDYYNLVFHTYLYYGMSQMATDLCYMELPKDQDVVDKVFQICDYIGVLYKELVVDHIN